MNKNNHDKKELMRNMIDDSSSSYLDKLAVLKYLVKNDSKNISSLVSNTLKKNTKN